MRLETCITLVFLFFASSIYGADGTETLRKIGFETIIATPTNVTISIRGGGSYRLDRYPKIPSRTTFHPSFLGPHEEMVLIPDQEVRLFERHGHMTFTPVSFKGQQKGFKIAIRFLWGLEETTTAVVYVALGDTLTEMKAEDVDMIMAKGKWVKDENPQPVILPREDEETSPPSKKEGPAAVSPPSRKENETPATVVEVEQSKHNNLWLYVGIVFCLFPILYLLRRKLKTGNYSQISKN